MSPTDRLMQCIRDRRFEDALIAWRDLGENRLGDPILVELGANLHANLGQMEEEIELWRRLGGMLPSDSRIARSFASALLEQRRLEEATEVMRQFVSMHPDVDAYCLLGSILVHRGLYADALAAVAEARQLDAEQPTVAAFHAHLLARNGYLTWARAIAEAVERTSPVDNQTCAELGKAWRMLREFERAIQWFTKALEADTADMDTAVSLASTYEQNRHPEVARRMAEAALQFDPTLDGMHRLLLRLDRIDGRTESVRTRARELILRNPSDEARRGILLEWALTEQQAGNPEEAFRLARDGNEAACAAFTRRGFTLGTFNDMIDRVAGFVPRRDAPPRRDSHPAPVFLVGVPRSGTTLTQQMLQAHPHIETLDEMEASTRVLRNHLATRTDLPEFPAVIDALDDEDWHALREAYWADLRHAGVPDAAVVVDKLPLSLVRMQYLSRLFPDAKMVMVVRDPRDALWSNFLQDYEPNPFTMEATDLDQVTRLVDSTLRLWVQWRDAPPLPAVEVVYEDLVDDPEPTMRRVLQHIGVPWNGAVLTHYEQAASRRIRTPSYHDVSQPLYTSAVGRWRQYRRHLEPYLARLDEVAEALGYGPLDAPDPQLVA